MTRSARESSHRRGIYALGSITALILLAYCLVTMVMVLAVGGQPQTVQGIYDMLRQNRLVGLLRLDMLTTLLMPLYYLLFASLYAALREPHEHSARIAALLGCIGVTLFLAAPSFFSWLTLSDKFAAATTEAQRTMLLAAGEAILASDLWHSSGAFVGGLLLQTSTVLISILMLRGSAFSKPTAWVGIAAHGLDLAHIVALPFIASLAVTLMVVGGTLYLAWFPLLARDFYRLAIGEKEARSGAPPPRPYPA